MCTYVCTHVYVQHNRKNRKHRREQNIVHALITFTCIHFWFWSIYPGIHWVYHVPRTTATIAGQRAKRSDHSIIIAGAQVQVHVFSRYM